MKIKKVLACALALGLLTACGDDSAKEEQPTSASTEEIQEESTEKQEPKEEVKEETEEKEKEEVKEEVKDDVPREHRAALQEAENYLSFTAFSKKGLFKQLTADAGSGYPEDAANYALENLEVDWKEQALKSAKNYLEITPMSDAQLFKQLTSDAGEGFTEEEAQYALDNLEQ